jgi:hypothetical protein
MTLLVVTFEKFKIIVEFNGYCIYWILGFVV